MEILPLVRRRSRASAVLLLLIAVESLCLLWPVRAFHSVKSMPGYGDKSLSVVESRGLLREQQVARKGFLTVSQDEVVRRVKPILCGKWLLKESRVDRQLWGQRLSDKAVQQPANKVQHEVMLATKGRLEQPLDSSLRGLGWDLVDKDMFGSSELIFKIVHPPPECKIDANDQLPSIHYYTGSFCEGLDRVEGWIERYAEIDDPVDGAIRRKIVIGRFRLEKQSKPGAAQMHNVLSEEAAAGW